MSARGAVGRPEKYCYGENFRRFIHRVGDFVKLSELAKNLHLVLLSLVDNRTYDLLRKVVVSDEMSKDMEAIGELYKEKMNSQENLVIRRVELHDVKQEKGETVEKFGNRLQEFALHAYPAGDGEEMETTIFIKGLKKETTRLALYQSEAMGYSETVRKAIKLEQAELLWFSEKGGQESCKWVKSNLEKGYQETGKKERCYQETGKKERCYQETGKKEKCYQETGNRSKKYYQATGNREICYQETGNRKRCYQETGNKERCYQETGNRERCYQETGKKNRGYQETDKKDCGNQEMSSRKSSKPVGWKQGPGKRWGLLECWYCKGPHPRRYCVKWKQWRDRASILQKRSRQSTTKSNGNQGPQKGKFESGNNKTKGQRKNSVHTVASLDKSVKHLYAFGTVYGSKAKVFIDSGSSCSIVSPDFVKVLGFEDKIEPCGVVIRSFSGEIIPIRGQIQLELTMGGQAVRQKFLITNCMNHDDDILVGLDYMKKGKIVLDVPKAELVTPYGATKFITKPRSVESVKKIRCWETTTVPGSTVSYVKGSIPGKEKGWNTSGLFFSSRNRAVETGMLVANSLVCSEGNIVVLQVINPGDEPLTIYKGGVLGNINPVETVKAIYGVHKVTGSAKEVRKGEKERKLVTETRARQVWDRETLFSKLRIEEMEITKDQKENMKDLVWKYRECFSVDSMDLGCCNMYKADIHLKPDAKAKWIANRQAPYQLRGIMDKKIKEMEGAGIVEKYGGNSPWNSPTMLVKKEGSNEYRVVQDARYLNSQTQPDAYEMPNMQRVLDDLRECQYLSTMDITSSFNQIELSERSKPLTAFMHNSEQYVLNRMTMGTRNSSAKFCRMIDRLLGKVPFTSVLAYIDDLLVGSKDFESHVERLRFVFGKIQGANLKLKPSKCFLFRKEISFLGYKLSKEGIKIDDSRIQPILDLKPPTNVKGVQSLIGIFNFNRNFIKDFAGLTKPLYQLLKKETKFEWTKECEESFNALKKAMTTAPCLALPDLENANGTFRVEVDASGLAWGAVLSQEIGGKRKTIAYYSKCIPKFKRKLGASRLEFLGLYHALKHWKNYLLHTHFEVLTDCIALTNLETLFKKSSTIQQRQMQELQDYNMTITHISGVSNVQADFLSRNNYEHQSVTIGTQTNFGKVTGNVTGNVTGKDTGYITGNVTGKAIGKAAGKVKGKGAVMMIGDNGTVEQETSGDDIGGFESEYKFIHVGKGWQGHRNLETIWEKVRLTQRAPELVGRIVEEQEYPGVEESVMYDQNPPERKITLVTMEEIRQETAKDPVLSMVAGWLEKGEKPLSIQNTMQPAPLISLWKSYNLLSQKDGIVYRKWSALKPPFIERDLIVVPHTLQEKLLTYYHCGILSIHAGVETCLGNCLRRFWWSKMREEFQLFIGACVKCNQIKRPTAYLKAPLQPILNTDFNDCIAIDHIVPSLEKVCFGGYRYILTIVDCFSNYLVAVPVRTQSAEETVKVLMNSWVLKHGVFKSILSDNHKSFCSELYTGIMEAFGVEVRKCSSYKSSTNGRVERQNERINGALRAVVPVGKYGSWVKYLPYVVSALNTFKNKHTGFSANFLVYGRELRLPQEFFVDQETEESEEEAVPVATKAYRKYRKIKDSFYKARENAKVQAGYMKTQYDKKANLHVFKAGDHCFLLINGEKGKFQPRWKGPVLIVKRISDHNYIVLRDPEGQVYETVNIQRMKPYKPNRYSPVRTPGKEVAVESEVRRPELPNQELEWVTVWEDPLEEGGEEQQGNMPRSSGEQVIPQTRPSSTVPEGQGPRPSMAFRAVNPSASPSGTGPGVQRLRPSLAFGAINPPSSPRRSSPIPERRQPMRSVRNKERKAYPEGFVEKTDAITDDSEDDDSVVYLSC